MSWIKQLCPILKGTQRVKATVRAYFKSKYFYVILSAPKEDLHQLLLGLYSERYHIIYFYFLAGCRQIRAHARQGEL